MTLIPPYITLPITLLFAWLGMRQGVLLRSRGFKLNQGLKYSDLSGVTRLIPLFVLVVPPLLLLRNYPQCYWYLPLPVQLYSGGAAWAIMLSSFFHVAGVMFGIGFGARTRLTISALLITLALSGAAEFVFRKSPFLQPPVLRKSLVRDGIVFQTSDATCAAAAVANIAGLFGMLRTEREMVELMGTTAYGTNIAQVWDGLRKLGLYARPKFVASRSFHELHAPAVLFVAFGSDPLGHATCFVRESSGTAEIWDSQGGKSFQDQDQLASYWLGYAIEIYEAAP